VALLCWLYVRRTRLDFAQPEVQRCCSAAVDLVCIQALRHTFGSSCRLRFMMIGLYVWGRRWKWCCLRLPQELLPSMETGRRKQKRLLEQRMADAQVHHSPSCSSTTGHQQGHAGYSQPPAVRRSAHQTVQRFNPRYPGMLQDWLETGWTLSAILRTGRPDFRFYSLAIHAACSLLTSPIRACSGCHSHRS